MRFAAIAGIKPELTACRVCNLGIDRLRGNALFFDMQKGGIVCEKCSGPGKEALILFKGTLKQLLWIEKGSIKQASLIKFTKSALKQGTKFLEAFIPYHIGKKFNSLKFLKEIR